MNFLFSSHFIKIEFLEARAFARKSALPSIPVFSIVFFKQLPCRRNQERMQVSEGIRNFAPFPLDLPQANRLAHFAGVALLLDRFLLCLLGEGGE